MPYVITEPCIGSKDTSCYDVCPVDAIQPTPDATDFDNYDQMFIDPVACIDCGACSAVCPVEAIYNEDDVPQQWQSSIAINRRHFEAQQAP
ncbi:4Fe-4S binding protein [Nocardia sp. CDC153]|uniref:4Fe-4S dicluster domain-containing protein n=1 Tax=Nocardia sp. CDC153 TaxID=3112167 RepID=UPI002DB7AB17|nr:4Fe-4S binding protein [Nocardia sp. CDC153]MEC3957783.1 4Fe-4S binding protein [Nocardia sp. CDC153]